jgi:hypothetical protein
LGDCQSEALDNPSLTGLSSLSFSARNLKFLPRIEQQLECIHA